MKPIHVLLFDRRPEVQREISRLLAQVPNTSYRLTSVQETDEAVACLKKRAADALLLGCPPADRRLEAVLVQLLAEDRDLPVVMLADSDEAGIACEETFADIDDYVVRKEFNARALLRVLRHAARRKRIRRELEQREEFFRLITENVTDLIAVIDRQGRRLYNSPSYRHTVGVQGAPAGSDSFAEIHPDDKAKITEIFNETLASGIGRRSEYRMRLRDGTIRHIESQGSVIQDRHGQPDRIVVVSRDITERKRDHEKLAQTLEELRQAHTALQAAQKQIVQAEKLEAINTFVGGIAHEVKNPLQTLLLGIDFVKTVVDASDTTTHQVLKEMDNAARRADAVIQGLLESARYRQKDTAEHDLHTLMRQAAATLETECTQQSVRVEPAFADDVPRLHLDGTRIRHVFIKLFQRLIQGMPGGGTLLLKTRLHTGIEADPAAPPALAQEHAVVVEIEASAEGPDTASTDPAPPRAFGDQHLPQRELDLLVVKKVVELFGGVVQTPPATDRRERVRLWFRAEPLQV